MIDSGRVPQSQHVFFPRVSLATTRSVEVQVLVDFLLIDIDNNSLHTPLIPYPGLATKNNCGRYPSSLKSLSVPDVTLRSSEFITCLLSNMVP